MSEGKRNIITFLIQEYDIKPAEDIQDALKNLLGGIIKEMMEVEMRHHLANFRSKAKKEGAICLYQQMNLRKIEFM